MSFMASKKVLPAALLAAIAFTSPNLLAAQQGNVESPIPAQSADVGISKWSQDELERIIKADDLKISPFREDGVTYGTPTWIWCVEVDGDLYVRAYNGKASSWYKAAVREKAGRIIAAGMTREVHFSAVEGSINDRIDEAYSAKYSSSPYLKDMIREQARGATVKILPKGK